MTFRALTASGADRSYWLRLWRDMPDREIYANPAFVELCAGPGEEPVCLTWHSSDLTVLMPMKLRPLGSLSWARGFPAFDLEGPYGYGGPYVHGVANQSAEFWRHLDAWATDTNVVSAFSRLSLFQDQYIAPQRGEVLETQRNIVRSLNLTDSELLADYEHKVRKNVKKAQRHGLKVTFDETGHELDSFLAVYLSTMARRAAPPRYNFTTVFFETLVERLLGNYVFVHVWYEGNIISTELILRSSRICYSFLGGTLSAYFDMRPNDLLKHEATRWLRDQGLSWYVLGGGFGADDSIYRYKQSFAPRGVLPFKVWRCVFNKPASHSLVMLRHEAEPAWEPTDDYFPSYRS